MLQLSSESLLSYDLHYSLGSLLYILGTLLALKKQTNMVKDVWACVCVSHIHAQVHVLSWIQVYVCVVDFKSFI